MIDFEVMDNVLGLSVAPNNCVTADILDRLALPPFLACLEGEASASPSSSKSSSTSSSTFILMLAGSLSASMSYTRLTEGLNS